MLEENLKVLPSYRRPFLNWKKSQSRLPVRRKNKSAKLFNVFGDRQEAPSERTCYPYGA